MEKTEPKNIRQPIVTVCGHVDHGKTSILDSIRQSSVQEKEAGGITQKISFTLFPKEKLKASCPLIEKSGIKLEIPGFLFIDTPGHAAFTNLRKRGGALADLAVLVIDINEGIKPQTAEVIQILKHNKTPFIVSLNKIDNISGWNYDSNKNISLKESIESQMPHVQQVFNEKYMTIIGSLNSYGFDADLYYNIKDFAKKIALVPTSAHTKQGIQELIMVLCGLSQKYLAGRLELKKQGKGVMLEVKTEKSINYSEAILYDGTLSKENEIIVANFENPEKPLATKIRILEEILPLSNKFVPKEFVKASTGLRMQLTEKTGILPGMPFEVLEKEKLNEIKKRFKEEISESIDSYLSKQGIIAKADSLGSLEALLTLLKENNIPVVKAGIGKITKTDIISAKTNFDINELDAVIAGFNVSANEEAEKIKGNIKIITDDVIYKLIENLIEFRKEKAREIEKRRLMSLSALCKLEILHQYVFRNTKPAIFGVRVSGGKLVSGINLINEKAEKIGKVKNIQSENKPVESAEAGTEVAVSIPGVNYEKQIKNSKVLYSDISESQFRTFKKNKDLLSQNEIKILQEIAEIKRLKKPEWGLK